MHRQTQPPPLHVCQPGLQGTLLTPFVFTLSARPFSALRYAHTLLHAECSMHNNPYIDAHYMQACYKQLLAGNAPAIPTGKPEQHSLLQAAMEEAEQAAASDAKTPSLSAWL